MTRTSGDPTIEQSAASAPSEGEGDGKGKKPLPGDRAQDGASTAADDPAAIDLDTARDRAS